MLLLTTAVFWCDRNGPYRSVCDETHTYQSLSNCFHNVWAMFVGVSVPLQPRTTRFRAFFFLYVCFCFAIRTVFQAFFVSYLVEPKYGKKLENLDDLLNSDVVYGYHPVINFFQDTLPFADFVKFLEYEEIMEDCSDVRKYVERMITKGDIATLVPLVFATYIAREMGTVDVSKVICSLGDDFVSVSVTVLFKKGNPLLESFNIVMRRYLEAGLL